QPAGGVRDVGGGQAVAGQRDRAVGPARVVDVEAALRGVAGRERQTEQALLRAARDDLAGQIEERRRRGPGAAPLARPLRLLPGPSPPKTRPEPSPACVTTVGWVRPANALTRPAC